MYYVEMRSVGNPDFGENPKKAISSPEEAAVLDLKGASVKCRQYIGRHGLGSGNWVGGNVYNESGDLIARVSYNGRVWMV